MLLILCSRNHPTLECFLFRCREWILRRRRRHDFAFVFAEAPSHHLPFLRLAGYDSPGPRFPPVECTASIVEPEPRLAGLRVEPVTLEAVPRQNWTNVIRKLRLLAGCE